MLKPRRPLSLNESLLRRQWQGTGISGQNNKEARFDDQNGQMYMLSTARALRPEDRNWTELSEIQQAKFEEKVNRGPRSRARHQMAVRYLIYLKKQNSWPSTGSRSLVDMAVTTIVQNIDLIDEFMLEPLPQRLLMLLWRQLSRRYLVNFRIWKIFSKLIVRSIDPETGGILPCELATLDLFRYEQSISQPVLPLLDYIEPLISPSFDFISILSITVNLSCRQLYKLTKLRNLGALHLMHVKTDEVSEFCDRVMRVWSDAVSTQDAFRVLRVLVLWGYTDVTLRSLEYASKFPVLGLFQIRHCSAKLADLGIPSKIGPVAEKYGWTWKMCDIGPCDLDQDLLSVREAERQRWDEHQVTTRNIWDGRPGEIFNEIPPSSQKLERPESSWMYMGRHYEHPWQIDLHSHFTWLGRKREESDLEKAGVKLPVAAGNDWPQKKKFYVKDRHIPPIPIASLHLGSADDYAPYLQQAAHYAPDLSFHRLFNLSQKSSLVERSAQETSNTSSSKRSGSPTLSGSGSTIRASKKMKLDTVLSSFSSNR